MYREYTPVMWISVISEEEKLKFVNTIKILRKFVCLKHQESDGLKLKYFSI